MIQVDPRKWWGPYVLTHDLDLDPKYSEIFCALCRRQPSKGEHLEGIEDLIIHFKTCNQEDLNWNAG